MKKTLIALAALASTAAFAQSSVNLTGKFGVAYESGKTAAGVKGSGFGVTDGDVVFTAVEDLGAGMKAAASMGVRVRGRGAANADGVGGRDATVSLSGDFGSVAMGAVEAGNGIIGLASAGAPTIGQDNGVTLSAATNVDLVKYTSPALIPGLTARFLVIDSIGAPGQYGLQSTAVTKDATVLGVAYAAGAIAADADFTKFGKNSRIAPTPPAIDADSRIRLSGSYDLGVAKLGAGFQTIKQLANGPKDKQFMLGVSVPMGALTLGATYATRKVGSNNASGVDAKGYELGANYALSKRTGVQVAYLNQKLSAPGSKAATNFRVRLMHSF